jgi:hypothetical protein
MRLSFASLVVMLVACGDGASASHDAPIYVPPPDGPDPLPVFPDETWRWVTINGMACADGFITGVGVNLKAHSQNLLIYLEGGGACWSESTCYTLMTAAHFTTGYKEADFTAEVTDTSSLAAPGGWFDRTSATNPFKDYNYIYVPYCTGDMHTGKAIAVSYGAHSANHVGYTNISALLPPLVATVHLPSRVVLAGSSAGGFGATYNYAQVQHAFGPARVDLIDDSGIYLGQGVNTNDAVMRTQWNLAATTPAGCSGCATSFDALVPFYAASYPTHRFAMLSYTQDSTIPSFDGISTSQFTTALDAEASAHFDPAPPVKYFFDNAQGHVLWFKPTLAQNNVTELQWLTQMVSDDASWASQHP